MKGKEKTGSNLISAILHTNWHIATSKYKIKNLECFILSNTVKMQNMKIKELEIYLLLTLKKSNVSKLTLIKMHFKMNAFVEI